LEIAGNVIALLNPTAIAFPKQAIICIFKPKGDRIPKPTAQNLTRLHNFTNPKRDRTFPTLLKPKYDKPIMHIAFSKQTTITYSKSKRNHPLSQSNNKL
jgi:hypothetical protein